ncbi:MAG: hypothetical protein ACREAY_09035 [Nitrososphaera sp.]|uniref:hypothetical protein n=1 Tax=Nitrososphaera sp. TaxID=1971748 RepID=UPI003D6E048A
MPVDDPHLQGKQVVIVIGHSNEPTFGVEAGVTDGLHNLELSLADFDTKMPLAGAQLKADKYYFKDIESFNAADSAADASANQTGVTVGGTFGQAGFYQARQMVSEGIYGYRIYGTIDYFGEASIPIDVTTFCRSTEGNTTKFNSPGFVGGYGCVPSVETLAFPANALDNGAKDTAVVKVVAVGPDGENLRMSAKLRQGNELVTQGYTPFYFQGKVGDTYKVSVANFGSRVLDRWDDGSTSKDRTTTLSGDSTLTASYRLKNAAITSNSTSPTALAKSNEAQLTVPVSYSYANSAQSPSSTENTSLLQLLGVGISMATAGVAGLRKYKGRKDGPRGD